MVTITSWDGLFDLNFIKYLSKGAINKERYDVFCMTDLVL